MLQLCNIGDTVALKLEDVEVMLGPQLRQAQQRGDAVAREN